MMLGGAFDYINLSGNVLSIGAETKSGKIYNFAKKHNIGGFEFLQNIPGTLGGLIKMNAGLAGISISDRLTHVLFARGWVKKDEINFAYRRSGINEPVLAAKFKAGCGFDAEAAAQTTYSSRQTRPR